MVVLPKRYKFLKSKSIRLSFAVLFISLSLAFINAVWSVYVDSFLHNMSLVGIFSSCLTALAVVWLFVSTPIIERFPERKVFTYSAVGVILAFVLLYFANSFLWLALAAVFWFLADVLRLESFGILFRDAVKISEIGKAEGLNYTLSNIGWLVGPVIAGFLASITGARNIFLVTIVPYLIALFIFHSVKVRHRKQVREAKSAFANIFDNTISFFKNKEMIKTYIITGGISLYWAVMYVYIPLFIVRAGLSYFWVGLFLSAMVIPLVVFEYPVGRMADRIGCKKFFLLGYAILAAFSLTAFFMTNIYAILMVFVFASIGTACLEGTTESYFFKITKKSQGEKFYGPVKSGKYVFNALSKAIGAGVLLVLPHNYIFLALFVEMLFFLAVAATVKEKRIRTSFKKALPIEDRDGR